MAQKAPTVLSLYLQQTPVHAWERLSNGSCFFKEVGSLSVRNNRETKAAWYCYALSKGAVPSTGSLLNVFKCLVEADGQRSLWPFEVLFEQGLRAKDAGLKVEDMVDLAIKNNKNGLAAWLLEKTPSAELRPEWLLQIVLLDSAKNQLSQIRRMQRLQETIRLSYHGGGSDTKELVGLPCDEKAVGKRQSLIELLLKKGLDINWSDESGRTAVGCADGYYRSFLVQQGAALRGKNDEGQNLLTQAIAVGDFEFMSQVLAQDPEAFSKQDEGGTLPAQAWWSLPTTVATEMVSWWKEKGWWPGILAATDGNGRDFLTAGLSLYTCPSDDAGKENLKQNLDWRLARLEMDLHSRAWVDPNARGETVHFWLKSLEMHDLVVQYVIPRRELLLQKVLDKADQQISAEQRPGHQAKPRL